MVQALVLKEEQLALFFYGLETLLLPPTLLL
jgi:hypothetical protein